MEQPLFTLSLRQRDKTSVKFSVYEALDFAEYAIHSDKNLYRIMLNRSWFGGYREQAAFYTLPEVLALFVWFVFNTLGFKLPKKVYPDDFPKDTPVKVYFDEPGKPSIKSKTLYTPFQDKIGTWYTYVARLRNAVRLSDLERIED